MLCVKWTVAHDLIKKKNVRRKCVNPLLLCVGSTLKDFKRLNRNATS